MKKLNLVLRKEEIENTEEIYFLHVEGEIDHQSKDYFETELNKLLERSERFFVFNFKDLKFVNSTGLGLILAFYEHLENQDKKLVFACVTDPIHDIMTAIGISSLIPSFETETEAVSFLREIA
jgi:anti-anti-sigma factor